MKRAFLIFISAILATVGSGRVFASEVDSLYRSSQPTMSAVSPDSIHGYFPSLKWHDVKPLLGRAATTLAISGLAKWAIVDVMKNNVHEMRPDRSANNSMPSRHAVWAYGLATTASQYLVPYSPFWGVGVHAAAAAVGFERVIDHKHYPGDVLAGAGIGIGTSILGDQLSRLIFHTPQLYSFPNSIEGIASLSFSSGASFPLSKTFGGVSLGSALISQLQFATEINGPWNLNISLFMQTAPLKQDYYYQGVLSHVGGTLGGGYSCPLADTPIEFTASAAVGMRYAFTPKKFDVQRLSPYAEISTRLQMHLTKHFTVGAQLGYSLSGLGIAPKGEKYSTRTLSAVRCSFVTVAHF